VGHGATPTESAVAVVGGTGRLGREIVGQLLAAGHRVVVVTRDPTRASDMATAGVDIRAGDLTSPASLAGACLDVDVVIASAHAMLGRGRYRSEHVDGQGHRMLIDAARAAGVRHFIYTSVMGASPTHPVDFWRTKFHIEEYLKASGLPWTILRPAAFIELHAHELIGKAILAGGTATILGAGERPMNFVAVRDVARLAVSAVATPSLRGRVVDIGGPENLTQNQVASTYARVSGRELKVRHLPAGLVRILATLIGPLHPGIARVMRASLAGEMIDQTFDPGALLAAHPMTLTRVEDVARERAERRL
jgi:uncharacterized protein YbjT (DUF2867 family)